MVLAVLPPPSHWSPWVWLVTAGLAYIAAMALQPWRGMAGKTFYILGSYRSLWVIGVLTMMLDEMLGWFRAWHGLQPPEGWVPATWSGWPAIHQLAQGAWFGTLANVWRPLGFANGLVSGSAVVLGALALSSGVRAAFWDGWRQIFGKAGAGIAVGAMLGLAIAVAFACLPFGPAFMRWAAAPGQAVGGLMVLSWLLTLGFLASRAPEKAGDARALLRVAARRAARLWPVAVLWLGWTAVAEIAATVSPDGGPQHLVSHSPVVCGVAMAVLLGALAAWPAVLAFADKPLGLWPALRRALLFSGNHFLDIVWFLALTFTHVFLLALLRRELEAAWPAASWPGCLVRLLAASLTAAFWAWLAASWTVFFEESVRGGMRKSTSPARRSASRA